MVCVYCGNKTQVSNSRLQKRGNNVWRRRTCTDCQATFTTLEKIDLDSAIVIVDKTVHTPFSRDKLFVSIMNSCKHRKTAIGDASGLTDTIISLLYPLITNASLDLAEVRTVTLQVLSRFDKAAAVQYEAFHPVKR